MFHGRLDERLFVNSFRMSRCFIDTFLTCSCFITIFRIVDPFTIGASFSGTLFENYIEDSVQPPSVLTGSQGTQPGFHLIFCAATLLGSLPFTATAVFRSRCRYSKIYA